MAFNPLVFSVPKGFGSTTAYPSAPFVSPEMFGAKGDGVTDDTLAIKSALAVAQAIGYKSVVGGGNYGVSSSIDISNFGSGLRLSLNTISVLSAFPSPSNWKTATPIFTVGSTGGSQVGLEVDVLYINGGNKADVVHILNNGCGGSRFHFGFTQNTNINVKISSITSQAASNYFTGDYWLNGIQAANITGGGSGNPEGTTFDVAFITGFIYGGLILNDGAAYTNVRGQLDFNGAWLTQVAVASLTGWHIGDTLTDTTVSKTGEVLGVYTFQGTPTLLVIETQSTTGGHSNFASGNSVTNGTVTTTISSVATTNQSSNNIYYDIIQAYVTAPFSRNTIITPYLGGIIGSLLFTNFLQSANSNSSITNSNQGLMVTNNGAGQIDLYNTAVSSTTPILDINGNLFNPGNKDVFLGTGSISNANVGVSLPTATPENLVTFANPGANGAVYLWNVVCPAVAGLSATGLFYIGASGSTQSLAVLNNSNITVTNSGMTLIGTQGTGVTRFVVTNIMRISLS